MKKYLMGLILLLSCLLDGCTESGSYGNAGTGSQPGQLTALIPTSAAKSIHVNTSTQYTVVGVYSDGSIKDMTSAVSWTSSDLTIATISPAGVVSGIGVGSATITAEASGISVTVNVAVGAANLLSIQISPLNFSAYPGLTAQYYAIGAYDDNTVQDISPSVTWASSDPVATITAAGLVTAISTGSSTISAAQGSITGSTALTIKNATLQHLTITPSSGVTMQVGLATQFSALGTYSDGGTADLTAQSSWSASGSVTINSATGLATGLSPGSGSVSATFGQQFATVTATVNSAVLEALVISPLSTTALKGTNQQYTAQATFSDGTSADVSNSALWLTTVTDGSITIRQGILAVASNTGQDSVTVTAMYNNLSATAQLSIDTPTTNRWSFVGGSQANNDMGDNSTLPSSRANAATTVDDTGQFWLFGGQTGNDLWTYNPSTQAWKLIVPNNPTPLLAADSAMFYSSVNNSIYLFGGWKYNINGTITAVSNTLYQYSIADNTWVSVPGGASAPGGRFGHRVVAATENGNQVFYLFGGISNQDATGAYVYLNDLWKFDPTRSTGDQWSQILPVTSGLNALVRVCACSSNQIPVRAFFNMWMANGKIWIFGGATTPANNVLLNDLWSFDPITLIPTLVTGENNSAVSIAYASYGQLGVPSPANTPGDRSDGVSWVDAAGNLWLTSGTGFGIYGFGNGTMNDIWRFDVKTLQWTWMGGANYPSEPTVYQAVGLTQTTEALTPSGRVDPAGWYYPPTDSFYLFGGWDGNFHNDLWVYGKIVNAM